MTTKLLEYYLTQLVRQVGAKNFKILLFSVCYSSEEHYIFSNIKVLFIPANCITQPQSLDLGIIHAFKCHCGKQLVSKTAAMIDGSLFKDAAQMKLDVLSAMHLIAEPWRWITPSTTKNCSVKCDVLIDHVSSNDSAVKLTEVEEDDWHSFQPLGVQCEDYPTCDIALEVCGVWSVGQMSDQHLTRPEEAEKEGSPEEAEEEGEVTKYKATFLDALKGLDAATKYIREFDTKNM
jgi:hypothetical protein